MKYNHAKQTEERENDGSDGKDGRFIDDPESHGSGEDELLCGYAFCDGRLYTFSGTHQNGKLSIRKTPMGLRGEEAIKQWCAYLKQMTDERESPTPFEDLGDPEQPEAYNAKIAPKKGRVGA